MEASGGANANGEATSEALLGVLTKSRLVDIGRELGVGLSLSDTKAAQIEALRKSGRVHFRELLRLLHRDELKAACRQLGLDDGGRARQALMARLLQARGDLASAPPPSYFPERDPALRAYDPRPGDIVRVRHRQWLVEEVTPPSRNAHLEHARRTRVELVCLDDDDAGRRLIVFWELELGAKVISAHGTHLDFASLDPPRHFAAYLHALKWSSVTATDSKLFQAPLRAGIQIMNHQLTPLAKALELPRANLFIADDVGLGKTIEAGLILQELQLRQRVEYAVIVCPASVALQWRDEMMRRFGLRFEIMSRAFIAERRQARGFGVNPWSTHHRFIVSHPLLRRPEYRDPLLQHIGERRRKSLLILDEAHVAAPASASKYAVDSKITEVIRDIAPRFENRLFLSATPHNGHSNSFSALLEILDPQRFTRGVPITSQKQLDAVMVRRLKEDLRRTGADYPIRRLVQIELRHAPEGATRGSAGEPRGAWHAVEKSRHPERPEHESGPLRNVGEAAPAELRLSELLAEYTALMKPARGRGRLVFVNLQKRLLSSVEAFARTLSLHARAVREGRAKTQLDLTAAIPSSTGPDTPRLFEDDEHQTLGADDPYGAADDTLDAIEDAEIENASRALQSPQGRALELLDEMERLAAAHRGAADGKSLALVEWIRRHQCAAARVGGNPGAPKQDRAWTDCRVLVFTEYGDTKRWLRTLLRTAIEGTDDADRRILELHGGMGDDQRDEVQRAFNAPPGQHPVRILLATDAAREGVNLQGHCADLFHYDVPWNPARMEQRNGRIDRTLQPAKEVRCHYFLYPQRTEDVVLEKLVQKVDVIQRELGSLAAVLMNNLDQTLEDGIDRDTSARLDAATRPTTGDGRDLTAVTRRELEDHRSDTAALRAELDTMGTLLNRSRAVLSFDPVLLRDALDVGFELAGAGKLTPADATIDDHATWRLPKLPESWAPTLDTLRRPRGRDEPFWQWRDTAPRPVLFEPPKTLATDVVHLHLEHPLVQRVLGRFRAQGFSAHDLSRVTVVRNDRDALIRVVGFGRLSVFGPGATRLHDELVSVAARWVESEDTLRPFADEADRESMNRLEALLQRSPTLDGIGDGVRARVVESAPRLFQDLWRHITAEADDRLVRVRADLAKRAATESQSLREILETQRAAIIAAIESQTQLAIDFTPAEKAQRDQLEQDRRHMHERLVSVQREIETEPGQVAALYDVALHRLEPVGLVVLWPESRA